MPNTLPGLYRCKVCGWHGSLGIDRKCPDCGDDFNTIRVPSDWIQLQGCDVQASQLRILAKEGMDVELVLELINKLEWAQHWIDWRDSVLARTFTSIGIDPTGWLMEPAIGYTRLEHEIRKARKEHDG